MPWEPTIAEEALVEGFEYGAVEAQGRALTLDGSEVQVAVLVTPPRGLVLSEAEDLWRTSPENRGRWSTLRCSSLRRHEATDKVVCSPSNDDNHDPLICQKRLLDNRLNREEILELAQHLRQSRRCDPCAQETPHSKSP